MDRAALEQAFWAAVEGCGVEAAVRARPQPRSFGIAVGKAALAMARGAGPVIRGVCVTHALDGNPLPEGWYAIESSHPVPDERALRAADAIIDIVASASPCDRVLALISGGASALIERPLPGMSLAQFVAEIQAVMRSGAPIHALNAARIARSQIKGGKLAAMSAAPITTLVASDVFDDDIQIVGSGPTVGPVLRPGDRVEIVMPIRSFAQEFHGELTRHNAWVDFGAEPITYPIEDCADEVMSDRPIVRWGEPRIALPANAGTGGRAQQLALALAARIRGGRDLVLVAGSDGMDGPPPRDRAAPAGAVVDGSTWDAIIAAGIDPHLALARADAGTALAAVGALFITGPTGINAGDVIAIVPVDDP